jgi:DNA ligase-1
MLAQTAASVTAALERLGEAAVEVKLDGVRLQVHRRGEEVRAFTRTLDDITVRVPEVVELVRTLPGGSLVLDGEVLALDADGRPRPFQVTASRVGKPDRCRGRPRLDAVELPVLRRPACRRRGRPDRAGGPAGLRARPASSPEAARVPRLVTGDPAAAQELPRRRSRRPDTRESW